MRTRSIKKQVWLNREEATLLKKKAKKVGLNESELVRNLMRAIVNNLNQIARKANSLNLIDYPLYQKEADKWNQFMLKIKKEFLLPQSKGEQNE